MGRKLIKQLEVAVRPVFWVFMGALAFGSVVLADQSKEKAAAFPIPVLAKQLNDLQYPEYPKDLLARIHGAAPVTTSALLKPTSSMSEEWGLASIGFSDALSTIAATINPKAQVCPKPIVVAVVDTGIDYTHPELRDSVWLNKGETGPWVPSKELSDKGYAWNCRDKSCNGIDDDHNGYVDDVVGWDFVHDVPLPFDTHGHGTHISGIINATAGNGFGKGAGACPAVALMGLKYYDNGGSGYNNLANTVRAIEYAIANGAQIINYSGGGADPASSERAAVTKAQQKGVLFVAAAGNDGRNNDRRPYFPASYPVDNIIGVASINKFERLLPSSNFGKSVHVAAPGLMILSTLPGGKFGTMSGTSQATAFVTGAAALLASQAGTPSMDYHRVKEWVLEGTKAMKLNAGKQLVSAGLLSLPGSVQAQRAFLAKAAWPKAGSEVAVLPPTDLRSKVR